MSKRINVNPDHYKVAGRERQGEEVVATEQKQKFVQVQHDLAARAEQRGRSIEAMKGRAAQPAREAAAGRSTQARGKKKAAPRRGEPADDETEGGGPPSPGTRVPTAIRKVVAAGAAGAARLSDTQAAKVVARNAKKAVRKTKRAAVTVAASAGGAARRVVAKAKNAVTPRPKQALPKKPKAVRAGAKARPAKKK